VLVDRDPGQIGVGAPTELVLVDGQHLVGLGVTGRLDLGDVLSDAVSAQLQPIGVPAGHHHHAGVIRAAACGVAGGVQLGQRPPRRLGAATRPQTLGYGLTDSPAGQAAWIAEKFWAWTDNNGHPEDALSRQQILDEISVYWFTASATSSARLYWESFGSFRDKITAPSGLSVYPRDITRPSRREAEPRFTDLRWFEELPRGGHFAALEQPESLVEQVRGFFRLFR